MHYTEGNFHTSFEMLALDQGVSAHYLVREDGWIDSLVPEDKKSWHAGESSWRGKSAVNNWSIGIEIVNYGGKDFPKE